MDDDIYRMSSMIRSEVIDALIKRLHTQYIFPDVASEIASMFQQRESHGEYDAISEGRPFAETLTAHLREISKDSHLLVLYEHQEVDTERDGTFSVDGNDIGEICNYGFEKAERLAGNIGYLCINSFFSPPIAFRALITALDFIAHTNALIIDLRKASGGDLAMLKFFASYFFLPDPVHLNDIYWRRSDSTQQCWTLPYIPGQRYASKPLSILTSHTTSSTAEAFAYALQSQQRATVIGEVTVGEANLLERFHLSAHFVCLIPVGHITNPVTGANWEGIGVQPGVEVAQEYALKTAHTLALKYVLESNEHVHNSAQQMLEKEIRGVVFERERSQKPQQQT
jgi:C-terminal processing protease CtpA/Prc